MSYSVPCDWCKNGKVIVPGPIKGQIREEDCHKCRGTNKIEVRS